jgi:hypothetical protein
MLGRERPFRRSFTFAFAFAFAEESVRALGGYNGMR